MLSKFLFLFKSSTLSIDDVRTNARNSPFSSRYLAFLDIFEPIYYDYCELLNSNDRIDFDDMINEAIKHIESGSYTSKYKYILVDEFQDITQSRYRLIKSLLEANSESKLFCVGDDWQSIYRFSGSDLSIMTSFDKYFRFNEKMYLQETFRFNDKIADFSSNFIMKNPTQYRKEIISRPTKEDAVSIVWYDELNSAINEALTDIYRQNNRANVYVLGRYGSGYYKDLDMSIFNSNNSPQTKLFDKFGSLDLQYSTIHGVKGSQRDFVILIGVRAGNFGLPCEIEDDPVLNLVLAEDDPFLFGEERRLFYVGITRAVNQVYILADREKVSSFIEEIDTEDYEVTIFGDKPIKCPLCDDGFLVKRKGTPDFYGCSNYWDTGCKYTEPIPVLDDSLEKKPIIDKPNPSEMKQNFLEYMKEKGTENKIVATEWFLEYGLSYSEAGKFITVMIAEGLLEERGPFHFQYKE